jgi:hypothetical protein
MTHDELLAKINVELATDYAHASGNFPMGLTALRAVVELHKPVKDEWITYTTCKACRIDMDDHYSPEYPCPTIQAIEKELS